MKLFLYTIASFCSLIAMGLWLYVVIESLGGSAAIGGQPANGITLLIALRLGAEVGANSLVLAVVPLCIAIAYDRMTD